MSSVHPSSIVSPECEIGEGAIIGPWCVLAGAVKLGPGVRLIGNVYLNGPLTIGARTTIYPFSAIGFSAQHLKVKPGDPTGGVQIGQDCVLREHVTIHAATNATTPTTIGDRGFMMVNSHLAHDAIAGNDIVMVNNSALAGHAVMGNSATLGGGALVHQFARIGRLAFVGGGTRAASDVPPFTSVVERSRLSGINLIGLRRAGISREDITSVREAFRKSFRTPMTRSEMLETLESLGRDCPLVAEMAAFVAGCGNRAISVGYSRIERESGEAV